MSSKMKQQDKKYFIVFTMPNNRMKQIIISAKAYHLALKELYLRYPMINATNLLRTVELTKKG